MSIRKPPITHSRTARAIAAHPGIDRKQKAEALSAYHRTGNVAIGASAGANPPMDKRMATARSHQQAALAGRIGTARAGLLMDRTQAAHATQQADLANRIQSARLGQPQSAPKTTLLRSIGREKTGQFDTAGRIVPTPSARKDTNKTSANLGRQPQFGVGLPTSRH